MAKKREIGAHIVLDGEKEFKSAVTACNKSLATMKSEMQLVSAQTEGNANSLDALQKKHTVLQNILEEQVKKEEAVRKALEHSEEDYQRVGDELAQYRSKLESAQKALDEMEKSEESSSDAIEEQRKKVSDLADVVKKGEETYQRAESRVQNWKKSLNSAEAQTITATRALNENAAYMKEAEAATDRCATSIDKFGKKTQDLQKEIYDVGKLIEVNLVNTAVDASKDLLSAGFDAAISGATDLKEAQNQLQASTGSTAAEMEKYSGVMEDLYKNNYGDSIGDIANAMELVKQYTHETDPDKIKELTENAMALDDVFQIDLSEGIKAADTLMDDMGVSAEKAFDLIAAGAQNGLNQSGELADNLKEYTSLWSQAGFSAEEMFTILQNGLDSGAYNLDKVNDFVKEFGISLSDGRIEENIGSFSKETRNLFGEWKNGQASTKQVFNSVISDLSKMENKQEALTLASTVWSSLGEDNALDMITSLNDVNDAYENVEGTMNDIKKIKYDDVKNSWKTLGRTFQTEVLVPVAEKFLPAAQEGMQVLTENIDEIIPVATAAGAAVATIFVAKKAKDTISDVIELASGVGNLVTALGAQATATGVATAAQEGLNLAMLANPVTAVVAGVAALTAAVVIFSGDTETARDATYDLAAAADEVNKSAGKAAEELNKATAGIEASMSGNSASEATAYKLVDELEQLQNKSKLTADEQGRMKTVVGELNTLFPDMGLEIDSVTGKLSMGSEEIKEYVKNSLEMAKIEAVQKAVKETTEKLVDAEIEQTKAQEQLQETTDALAEIQEKRKEADQAQIDKTNERTEAQRQLTEAEGLSQEKMNELYATMMDQSEAQIEYNGTLMTTSEAYMQMAQDEELLTQKKKEQEEAQKELNDAVTSAQEEINTYTEYIDANTASTQNNTAANDANAESEARKQEASAASIEIAGQELQAYSALAEQQQGMALSVTNTVLTMQESVQSALQSQMNMFEEFNGGVEISKDTLLANMQSQIEGVQNWEQSLTELAEKGVDEGILQKLADMGPQGSTYVDAFNQMTAEELSYANDMWAQSIDIQSMSDQWGQDLTQAIGELAAGGEESWSNLAQSLGMKATESGEYVVQGLVTGMQSAQRQAENQGEDLGVKTVEAVDKGAGVASPSTKTKQSGVYIATGLINGISSSSERTQRSAQLFAERVVQRIHTAIVSGTSTVSGDARNMGTQVTRAIQNSLNPNATYNAGLNLAYGLANGISAGQSSVINAVANMCAAAVNQANASLEIHSPSRVFERIGMLSAEGLPVGFVKKIPEVESEIRSSMQAISKNALSAADIQGNIDISSTEKRIRQNDYGYPDRIVIKIPVYTDKVLTRTEVEEISLRAINERQKGKYTSKGVRVYARG